MKLNRKQIHETALTFVGSQENGARWSEILRHVHELSPETPHNSIHGAVHNLLSTSPKIEKVTRGVYQLAAIGPDDLIRFDGEDLAASSLPNEDQFYESFADWLVNDAEDVTCAVPLGGSWLKGKWGTPDVLGVLKPRSDDLLKFSPQIVAAEIKTDASQTVIAFGQASSYRLFAHKSYIVMPLEISIDEQARLKALCSVHGIGLVLFRRDKDNPEYRLVVTPATGMPDVYYANRMVRQLRIANEAAYRKLFD